MLNKNTVSQCKRDEESSFISKQQRFEGVIEAEVAASVDNDSNTGDDEAAVQTDEAIRFDRFRVDINHSVELSFTTLITTTCHIVRYNIIIIKIINTTAVHQRQLSTIGDQVFLVAAAHE